MSFTCCPSYQYFIFMHEYNEPDLLFMCTDNNDGEEEEEVEEEEEEDGEKERKRRCT